jgi:hypothetical protein
MQSEVSVPYYLNDREVARRLGVSIGLIRKLRRFGTGPAFLRIGNAIRYDPTTVEAWCARHTVTSTFHIKKEAL